MKLLYTECALIET